MHPIQTDPVSSRTTTTKLLVTIQLCGVRTLSCSYKDTSEGGRDTYLAKDDDDD